MSIKVFELFDDDEALAVDPPAAPAPLSGSGGECASSSTPQRYWRARADDAAAASVRARFSRGAGASSPSGGTSCPTAVAR